MEGLDSDFCLILCPFGRRGRRRRGEKERKEGEGEEGEKERKGEGEKAAKVRGAKGGSVDPPVEPLRVGFLNYPFRHIL